MGERESEEAVRRMWNLFEARKWDDAVAKFDRNLVVHWLHTKETFRGGRNFVEMNRAFPDWDHIVIERIVAKGDLVGNHGKRGRAHFSCRIVPRDARREDSRATEYWVEEGLEKPPPWRAPFAEQSG